MTDKEFCKLYNSFTGEGGMMSGLDSPKQLTEHRFTGLELKEFIEHCFASQFKGISKERLKKLIIDCTNKFITTTGMGTSLDLFVDEYLASLSESDKEISGIPSEKTCQTCKYDEGGDRCIYDCNEDYSGYEIKSLPASRVSESEKPDSGINTEYNDSWKEKPAESHSDQMIDRMNAEISDEGNPYLLNGDELKRTEDQRKHGK